MSKPDWAALAARFGAQEAAYDCDYPRGKTTYCVDCGNAVGATGNSAWVQCPACQRTYGVIGRDPYEAGAAQDGQASIALAWGAWLALVVVFAALALCVYGAAWINGAWLAPFAGLAR